MAGNILSAVVSVEAKGVAQTTTQVANALQKTERTFKSAGNAGFAFNQILREAPAFAFSFQTGLIGISNNLPIFTDALKKARESGASFGTIVKSLAANLVSLPALLSIGITALTIFSGNSKKSSEDTDALTKKTDEARQKQEDFKNALDKASSAVLSQASNLTELRSVLVGTSSDVQVLTDNIVNNALAQFLFDKKNIEVQKLLNAQVQQRLELLKKQKPLLDLKEFTIAGGSKNQLVRQVDEAQQGIRILNETAKALGVTFNNLLKPRSVPKAVVRPEVLEIKPLKAVFDIDLSGPAEFQANSFGDYFTTELSDYFSKPITTDFSLLSALAPKAKTDAEKLAQSTADAFNNGIQNAFAGSFSAIAAGIGEALAGGDISDAFRGFAAALGGALQAMGEQIISIGVAAVLAKKALASLFANPFLAIAAGAGLVAAGAAPKSALSKGFGGFRAEGGPVAGGKSYIVGERGPELFVPNMPGSIVPNHRLSGVSGGMGGNVVFRISGNSLVGVLASANSQQTRLR